MKQNFKAFTLVELMVVVVILSVLATVGFISYENYLGDTRDSKRLAQLSGLRDGMRLAITKWQLPLPDDAVEIRNSGTAFLYQGYAWKNVLSSIAYSENTFDPLDETPYTYLLSRNRKDFQLLGFLEKYNSDVISNTLTQTYAAEDYSQRYPNVFWKKLWILLEQKTNTPLQEMSEYSQSGYIDLQDSTTNLFDAYITDSYLISWKESNLVWIIPYTTCKKILETWWSFGNGIYNINPSWLSPFEVYCNMEIDGGWWTLVARSSNNSSPNNFWWLSKTWTVRDNNAAYSLWEESTTLGFWEIMISSYVEWKNIEYAAKTSIDKNYIKNSSNYWTFSRGIGCTEVYPISNWMSPCDITWQDWKTTDHSALVFWGLLNYSTDNLLNDTHYFFDEYARNSATLHYWMESSWWNKTTWDGLGVMENKQGMIFVR